MKLRNQTIHLLSLSRIAKTLIAVADQCFDAGVTDEQRRDAEGSQQQLFGLFLKNL